MEAGSAGPQPEVDVNGTASSFYTCTSFRRYCAISTTIVPDSNNRKTAPHCAFCGEVHCAMDCQNGHCKVEQVVVQMSR